MSSGAVLLVAFIAATALVPPASAGGYGPATAYPLAQYDLEGDALYCHNTPAPAPTLIVVGFDGKINGVPVQHLVMEFTVLPVGPGNAGCITNGFPLPNVWAHLTGTATGTGVG